MQVIKLNSFMQINILGTILDIPVESKVVTLDANGYIYAWLYYNPIFYMETFWKSEYSDPIIVGKATDFNIEDCRRPLWILED